MKKNIILEDEKLLDEFLAIFSIGLAQCLENDLMHPLRAGQWLSNAFSRKKGFFSEELVHALNYMEELDACYGTDYYEKSVVEARNKFVEIVKKSVKNHYPEVSRKLVSPLFLEIFNGDKG